MAEVKTLVTAEQFNEMSFPDVRTELVDGEIVQMSLPGYKHGRICSRIDLKLRSFVEAQGLGEVVTEVGFVLRRNPDMVRGPDIAFVSREKLQALGETSKFWPGPPDLAVEVLSPDDRASDVLRKVRDYLEAGTRLVWVADPETETVSAYRGLQQVRVYRSDEELPGEDVLPGFSLKVAEIFG